MPIYVILVDENHYIVEANKAVYDHLKVNRDEILGKYCPMVIHGFTEPFPGCPLEESAEKGQPVERELFDQRTNRWVRSAIYPIKANSPDGKRLFLHMVHDITGRKQAEEALKDSHRELRLLSAHLESVREEEKKKIARDLHDETSQLIAGLNAYLETAIRILPPGAAEARSVLKKASVVSVTILDGLHRLIYDLRPTALDELGLVAAINSLADNYLSAAGIKVNVAVTGKSKRLADTLETVIFRAVQEAITNIIKHANASEVRIKIHFGPVSIAVSVKDNGNGFKADRAMSSSRRGKSLGLLGMKERMLLANGVLKINSRPGHGTEVILEAPLKQGAG